LNKDLLAKFLQGRCTPKELQQIAKWADSDNFQADLDQYIESNWTQVQNHIQGAGQTQEHSMTADEADQLFETIMTKAQATDTQSVMPKNKVPYWRYAAVLLVLALTSWAIWQWSGENYQETAVELVELTTPVGEKKTVLLSDGSEVILNSNSSIQFTQQFTDSTRIIKLKGEAYFKVAKDPDRPFSVVAKDIWTTALGTEFNVDATEDVRVALNEGKVQVHQPNHSSNDTKWILKPGEKITYFRSGNYYVTEQFSQIKETGWTEGILYFDNQPFAEVMAELAQWYGVEFNFEGAPIAKSYSATFKNESLENVLIGMSYTLGFEYEITDNQVSIVN